MAETILLEIVTPTGVALREQVLDVTAPSVSGERILEVDASGSTAG